jgi:hypothetical protein
MKLKTTSLPAVVLLLVAAFALSMLVRSDWHG